jgi:PEP-CTERM motif-containing protein
MGEEMKKDIIRTANRKNRAYGIMFGVVFCLIISFSTSVNAGSALVDLTGSGQGEGNKGESFRPVDENGILASFEMTAMSLLNPGPLEYDKLNPAPWPKNDVGPGTVYIAEEGAGVQTNKPDGSKGISGSKKHENEELIFTFDNPVLLADVTLEIADIELKDGSFKDDDPILFIHDGLLDTWHTLTEEFIAAHFVQESGKKGTVNFGDLSGYLPNCSTIDMFKIRETNSCSGHIFVSGVAVPEPATMTMLVLGSLAFLRKRTL